jgi:hypothetical protein
MRFWPFGARTFLDAEDEAWQAETWRWFLDHFGGESDLRRSRLVTPTPEFFPATDAVGHALAEHLFSCVRRHARMADWECRLVAQPRRPELQLSEFTALKLEKGGPAGTFSVEGNQAVITYDPAALDDPSALVATLVHELCHYRIAALGSLPPGGAELVEFATDLATVYFGFGIFGANSAFQFRQHGDAFSQGWRWSRLGYLDPRTWCFSLAVFFMLRGDALKESKAFLRPHLFSDLRAASAYLKRHPLALA